MKNEWEKNTLSWTYKKVLYISIPFTWELPGVRQKLKQRSLFWDQVVVGGTAVDLLPDYFDDFKYVTKGLPHNGMLQLYNPMATRTTIGCNNKCGFCAVPATEGKFKELDEWPNLPVIIDNNLLAASQKHFDKVIDRLIAWGWAEFNQGLDVRLLNIYHAERLREIQKPIIRLALDHIDLKDQWVEALNILTDAGIRKYMIRSYALVGYDTDPGEAWERCNFIEGQGIKVSPAWYHRLDSLERGTVTEDQGRLGWNDYERRRIMQWFYQHKKAKE